MNVSDLTPDALAKLEAKLLADLEVVRKVRALLEEHQRGQGTAPVAGAQTASTPAAPAVAVPRATDTAVTEPPAPAYVHVDTKPTKTYAQWVLDGVRLTPPEGFVLGELKSQLYKDKQGYGHGGVKQEVSRLIRAGRVMVVKEAIGRIGNTYRYVPTAEELAEKAAAEAAAGGAPPQEGASAATEA